MKILKYLVVGLIVLVVAIVIVGFTLPSEYSVSREVHIKAEPEAVYNNISDFKQWRHWGVWFERDPEMKVTYKGTPGHAGHSSSWESASQGNGAMTLKEIELNEFIEYDLIFPDIEMSSTGTIELKNTDEGTKVVWTDRGDVGSDLVGRYFVLFIDDLLGPDFEAGLAKLKKLTESGSNKS